MQTDQNDVTKGLGHSFNHSEKFSMDPKKLVYLACMMLCSCDIVVHNDAERTFTDQENFWMRTSRQEVEVEFVHDSLEFVKYIGKFNEEPVNNFVVVEDSFVNNGSIPYLVVRGHSSITAMGHYELNKVEVHYKNLRRMIFPHYLPISLGVDIGSIVYTNEPITNDTIDLFFDMYQDSLVEVNANVLNMGGMLISNMHVGGWAQKAEGSFEVADYHGRGLHFNFGNLQTDSIDLVFFTNQLPFPYCRVDLYANDHIDFHAGNIIGNAANYPGSLFEVYYKGNPTIVNHDSLDTRVVFIDNN